MKDTNSSSPIFIHSLFRAGSTYIFNVFRRSSYQYWCYQEPLNEYITFADSEPEKLLQIHKQATEYLRHPELDKPYFYEFYAISKDIGDLLKRNLPYYSYFFPKEDELLALSQYFDCLITKSQGRPVLQCCRTSGRVKHLRSRFGGSHIFLWRNPWDQWWSYRIGFDTYNLWIMNSHTLPGFLRSIKNELCLPEFHDSDLFLEYNFFNSVRLSSQDSYKLFFGLWCHAMLEAKPACDFSISIDMFSNSESYRRQISNQFSDIGIDSNTLDFTDCDIPIGIYGSKDIDFFDPIENSVYSLLIEYGYNNVQIEQIKRIRLEHLPEIKNSSHIVQSASRDAMRARKIARDFQGESATLQKTVKILRIMSTDLAKKVSHLESDANELRKTIQSQENLIQSLEASLDSLVKSRSMKITAPLRLVGNLVKKIKHEIYLRFFNTKHVPEKGYNLRDVAFFFVSTINQSLKKIFIYLVLTLWGNQLTQKVLLRLFRKIPGLESKLKRIYTSIVYSISFQASKRGSQKIPDLSPTARRIYYDLKESIDRYHGGGL
jgi:hypothetical protein